jgi:hypothetical protein
VLDKHARLDNSARPIPFSHWHITCALCKSPRWKSDSLKVVEVPPGIDSNKVRCARAADAATICIGRNTIGVRRETWLSHVGQHYYLVGGRRGP